MSEFDITKHEFLDSTINYISVEVSWHGDNLVNFVFYGDQGNEELSFGREDAIALAKHFQLTTDDLKL